MLARHALNLRRAQGEEPPVSEARANMPRVLRAGVAPRGATARTGRRELTRGQGRGAGEHLTSAQQRLPAEIEIKSASRAARRREAAAHGPIHATGRRRARARGPSATRCTDETSG